MLGIWQKIELLNSSLNSLLFQIFSIMLKLWPSQPSSFVHDIKAHSANILMSFWMLKKTTRYLTLSISTLKRPLTLCLVISCYSSYDHMVSVASYLFGSRITLLIDVNMSVLTTIALTPFLYYLESHKRVSLDHCFLFFLSMISLTV